MQEIYIGKTTWPARCLAAIAITACTSAIVFPLPALAQMGPASTGGEATKTENEPLSVLNDDFRSIYLKARERCSEKTNPLIICYSDRMILVNGQSHDEVAFLPEKYTRLKVVDHVPLALFVLLDNVCARPLETDTREQLAHLQKLIINARGSLAAFGLDDKTLNRQYKLLDRSLSFSDQVLKNGSLTKDQLIEFCRELKPMIMQNADDAVATQLATMDKAVMDWKKKLGNEKFRNITVVIVSGHMPRDRHSCFQYFSRALHVKKEGLQIVYSEGEAAEKAARELVGTHVLDATIGEAFFNEKLRMHRDLLSDGAERYLNAHPPLSK